MIIDRNDSLRVIRENFGEEVLEVGCGSRRYIDGSIGVDMLESSGADIVGDVFEVFQGLPDSAVAGIYSSHFLEHTKNIEQFFLEAGRIIKSGGILDITVPHFSNPYFYSDPTHETQFGLYTASYFANQTLFSRRVPTYGHAIDFELDVVELGFKSPRPFYIRYAFKRAVGFIVNATGYGKEFWEENLCYLIPAYEVRYVLRRL